MLSAQEPQGDDVPAFAADTRLERSGDGRYHCMFNRRWFVVVGPNGGLIAALLLRAAQAEVGPALVPRSMTVHYLSPPVEGPAELTVVVDRAGRNITFLRVQMLQEGRLIATAAVVLGAHRTAPFEWQHRHPPSVVGPERSFLADTGESELPIRERWEQRWAIGVDQLPESVDGTFRVGGWIRLREPVPYDAVVLAAMSDAWVPASMVLSDEPIHTPTLELTMHFRADVAGAGLNDDDFCLAEFRQHTGSEGYLDESGEIWSPDGRLLLTCRQLGLVLEREGEWTPTQFRPAGPHS